MISSTSVPIILGVIAFASISASLAAGNQVTPSNYLSCVSLVLLFATGVAMLEFTSGWAICFAIILIFISTIINLGLLVSAAKGRSL